MNIPKEAQTCAADFCLEGYDYTLPPSQIAQSPAIPRESARLLVYERSSGKITHTTFHHFADFIPKDTLLVLNDTQVIRARIYAHKLNPTTLVPNEKSLEVFFHKFIDVSTLDSESSESSLSQSIPTPKALCLCQIKGRIKEGDVLRLITHLESRAAAGADSDISHSQTPQTPPTALPPHTPHTYAKVLRCLDNGMRVVEFFTHSALCQNLHLDSEKSHATAHTPLSQSQVLALLQAHGHIPLPPYIKRSDEASDELYYQSVFAKHLGSVAAPTASLHFGKESLEELLLNFSHCFVTLHVGAGTFMNVESEDIRAHQIHSEHFSLSPESASALQSAKKVLCIGTTAARCVEYHTRSKVLSGECDIFLYPGVEFRRVDYLLTNFHLPKSTLLMLVSAMVGREKALELYATALGLGYRFYSYGDGMLIL